MVLAIAVISILIASDPESKVFGLGVLCVGRLRRGVWSDCDSVGIVETHHGIRCFVGHDCRCADCGGVGGVGQKPALAAHETGLLTMYEIVPGFIACLIIAVLVSLTDKEPSREIQERFEKADTEYREAK